MPTVSVVMSSFNHEPFVAEAVESVLAQDYGDWEMIIRDDGSTDRTADIVSSYRDARIRHVRPGGHIGGAASLNLCLRQATGEYVAVMNSDDVMLPHRLSTQATFMREHPEVAACFSHVAIIDQAGRPCAPHAQSYCAVFSQRNRSRIEWLKYFFRNGNCLCHPSAFLRKTVYNETGPYDPLMLQLPDFDKWVALCARRQIHIHESPLLHFRVVEGGSNASADSPLKRERTAYEFTKVLERYAWPPLLDQLHEILPAWVSPEDDAAQRLLGLARAALSCATSPHHLFALDCLRRCKELRAGTEIPEAELEALLAPQARPFSLVFSRPAHFRVFFRSQEQSFSDERTVVRSLEAGATCSDTVDLPAGTVEVRLDFDGGHSSIQVAALSLSDRDGRELWNLRDADALPVEITGARQITGSSSLLHLVRHGDGSRLLLPEVAAAAGLRLRYSVIIHYDVQELVRDNERLRRERKAVIKREVALQRIAGSALEWNKRPWLRRLFRRWKPPGGGD